MEEHVNLPYLTENLMSSMSFTLPWNSTTSDNTVHIGVHNSYGSEQLHAFKQILNDSNVVLMTSAYNYGSNAIAQIQNFATSWANLRKMIRMTLSHGMFSHPLISFPVCGSTNNYDVQVHEILCMRWYITAATMPMFRISSDLPRRDPASLISGLAHEVAAKAINIRNMLLPYFHTILWQGDPITRPMLFDFYKDSNTFNLEQQYMVGYALMVAQPLLQHTTSLRIYLPPEAGAWYEYFGGLKYNELGWISLSVRETDWFMFIRQGAVIPLRNKREFAPVAQSFQNEYTQAEDADYYTYRLVVALNPIDGTANGSLFLKRTSLIFSADTAKIEVKNILAAQTDICSDELDLPNIVDGIHIYGIDVHVLTSNFTSIDLCSISTDVLIINYFV